MPDFCAARAVLAIVLIAALLGVVLALARQTVRGDFWIDLGPHLGFPAVDRPALRGGAVPVAPPTRRPAIAQRHRAGRSLR